MHQSTYQNGARIKILALGMLTFVILAGRFSTNWIEFYRGYHELVSHAPDELDRAEIRKKFENSIPLLRGWYVAQQVGQLDFEIESPNHKVLRWRLLIPAIGHILKLPTWAVLGLAPVGCFALILMFTELGFRWSPWASEAYRSSDAIGLGLAAGASAPFFTSMGWLGYYDSWLAVALICAAFARSNWVVALACALGPLVDERFVIGLPLALCVRYQYFAVAPENRTEWLKRNLAVPVALALAYSFVRLSIAGRGGSQTVGDYLRDFVLASDTSTPRRIFGAWEGLRVGWIAVAVIFLKRFWGLMALTVFTMTIGLYTAQDVARSVVLVVPVMLFGWHHAVRAAEGKKYRFAAFMGAAALTIPATHVTGNTSIPVDNLWSAPHELSGLQNDIGLMYLNGDRLQRNLVEAERIFRTLAAGENAEAQNNLGVMYANGQGVSKSSAEAKRWYAKAAESGNAAAQSNLGVIYATGEGVTPDRQAAEKWYRKAAKQGNAVAQFNLAAMLADKASNSNDAIEAARWYLEAAMQCHAGAQNNLGTLYATGHGLPKDLVQAYFWFNFASANGNSDAKDNLVATAKEMTPGQITTATTLAKSKAGRYLAKRK